MGTEFLLGVMKKVLETDIWHLHNSVNLIPLNYKLNIKSGKFYASILLQ